MTNIFDQTIWQTNFWNNSIIDYFSAFLVFLSFFLICKISLLVVLRKLEHIKIATKNKFDSRLASALKTIKAPFYMVVATWFASQTLVISDEAASVIKILLYLVIAASAIKITEAVIKSFFSEIIKKNQQAKPLMHFFSIVIKIVLWIFGIVFILSSFGIQVGSLITGLGISGVILALTLQNVILDLFSSLTLYLDKPIQVGDKITVGNDTGIVQKIGIKSTRLLSNEGHLIIVPNRNLTTISINNLRADENRKTIFSFTLPGSSTDKDCQKIISEISKIISSSNYASLEKAYISEYSNQGFKLEVICIIKAPNNEAYMNGKQQLSFDLCQAFKKAGIALTPTSKV